MDEALKAEIAAVKSAAAGRSDLDVALPGFERFTVGLSSKAAEKLAVLAAQSDLTLVTGDGQAYLLHRLKVSEHSAVLR